MREKTYAEQQEERRLKEVAAYQNRKVYKAVAAGRRARDRKQPMRMNPFSSVSQPRLHAAWDVGFNSREAEKANAGINEVEKTNEN